MISYDTNVLIYAFEGTSEFAHTAQRVVTQGERVGASLSILSYQELVTGIMLHGGSTKELTSALDTFSQTKFIDVDSLIVDIACQLTKRYGKKAYGYDAIHLATAIYTGAKTFYTNDKQLLGLSIEELEIKSLVDF